VRARRGHPGWGPGRLVFEMGRRGRRVTRSGVYRALVRNGLVEPKSRRRRRKDYRRWERGTPMELWQLDVTASAFLTSAAEVKLVTGIDDHSRFCVIARAVMRATARPVCQAFVEAMRTYGIPEEVLTDNGKVFTGRFHKPGVPAGVLSGKICRENGITCRLTKIHSRPPRGRSSGCTRPCSASCPASTGRLKASRRCRPRWTPGGSNTTPTARTSRWQWPSPPAGSSPHPRRWTCASRPSSRRARASRNHRQPRPARCQHPACPWRQRQRGAILEALASLRWRWTGWSRPRETCSSAGSRSGSARPCPGGRSLCGWMRSACTCCWTEPGSRPFPPGSGPLNCPGWPPAAPVRQALRRCPPAPGR
jgi:hypothetical protein